MLVVEQAAIAEDEVETEEIAIVIPSSIIVVRRPVEHGGLAIPNDGGDRPVSNDWASDRAGPGVQPILTTIKLTECAIDLVIEALLGLPQHLTILDTDLIDPLLLPADLGLAFSQFVTLGIDAPVHAAHFNLISRFSLTRQGTLTLGTRLGGGAFTFGFLTRCALMFGPLTLNGTLTIGFGLTFTLGGTLTFGFSLTFTFCTPAIRFDLSLALGLGLTLTLFGLFTPLSLTRPIRLLATLSLFLSIRLPLSFGLTALPLDLPAILAGSVRVALSLPGLGVDGQHTHRQHSRQPPHPFDRGGPCHGVPPSSWGLDAVAFADPRRSFRRPPGSPFRFLAGRSRFRRPRTAYKTRKELSCKSLPLVTGPPNRPGRPTRGAQKSEKNLFAANRRLYNELHDRPGTDP